MGSRVRRGEATGPAQWLLVFLQARDLPPRAHLGIAVGPAEWLLVFLDGAGMQLTRRGPEAEADPTLGPGAGTDLEHEPAPLSALEDLRDTGHVIARRLVAQGI